MKKILFVITAILVSLIIPMLSEAHVKWFTELTPKKESIESILSPLFIFTSLLIGGGLALLTQILPKIEEITLLKKIDNKLDQYRKYSRHILTYGTAFALLIQILSGSIFAPEFKLTGDWVNIAMWITIILLVIPHHFATKLGSAILLILFFHILSEAGIFHMLDYGFYLSIIVVLFIGKTRLENLGFPFLYLGTGLSLCWVAVEKWVYPEMSLDIITHHGVPTFFFSPAAFIVLAAFIEFVVGYLLVVGVLNRILAFTLTLIFISTTMLFGYVEVIGHLMIHIILITFIIEGVSFYNPPIRLHKTRIDQMVFVFLNFLFILSTFILIYYRFA